MVSPGLTIGFDEPYIDTTSALTSTIPPPSPWPISIAGVTYEATTSFEPYRRDAFRHRSIQSQRESIDLNNEAGEGTVNTQGLWRRGMDDWSLGAGQKYLDRKGAVPNRFFQSKGVNPWTQWQLTLLNDTKQVYSTSNEQWIKAVAVGNFVYILTPNALLFTADWVHFTSVAGLPENVTGIATDGNDVWISSGSGIFATSFATDASLSLYVNGDFTSIGYANDRLMAASNGSIYNITHGFQFDTLTGTGLTITTVYTNIDVAPLPQPVLNGDIVNINGQDWTTTSSAAVGDIELAVVSQAATVASPFGTPFTVDSWAEPGDPLYTHPATGWEWTVYTGGSSQIYIGGNNGTNGGVYRTTLNTDGISLAVPVLALPMEGGEIPTALSSYLNFIFVGSNYGVRMCQTLAAFDPSGNQGDLRAGSLIPNIVQPVTQPVTGITASGRFVYFSWNNYDDDSTGLGRLDLSNFIDALSPAYASDLMIPGQGNLGLDWDPITNSPLMAVTVNDVSLENSVYVMDADNFVSSGTLDSGRVTFGIPDDKIAMEIDVRQDQPLAGSVAFDLALDGSAPYAVGTVPEASGRGKLALDQLRAELFNVITTLTPSPSPTLLRWTLKALPAVVSGVEISVVINCAAKINVNGQEFSQDPYQIYAFIRGLYLSQSVVPYIEGPFTAQVTVDSYDWLPNKRRDTFEGGYDTYLVAYLKTLSG